MITSLNSLAAAEHVADMQRAANPRTGRSAGLPAVASIQSAIVLRAVDADEQAVRDLADLDDALPLSGPVLLATVNGEAVAAMSIHDGRVVANPFRYTEQPVELLRTRAGHLAGRRSQRPSRLSLHPRAA